MVCGAAINSLELTLILQPAHSDVKIGPGRAHGKILQVAGYLLFENTSLGFVSLPNFLFPLHYASLCVIC